MFGLALLLPLLVLARLSVQRLSNNKPNTTKPGGHAAWFNHLEEGPLLPPRSFPLHSFRPPFTIQSIENNLAKE
jgi:hypothetical protein